MWTLVAVGVVMIRRGNRRAHAAWMIGTCSGLIVAGALALAPHRIVGRFLFG